MSAPAARPIVVFDGDCALCNGFVAWLIRHDPGGRFLITGSAGDVGASTLAAMGLPQEVAESTLVLATPEGPRLRADAVIGIGRELSAPWRAIAGAMRAVPRPLRDWAYDQVAKRRPRRPAEDPACGIPPADLVRAWRARLATAADAAALATGGDGD